MNSNYDFMNKNITIQPLEDRVLIEPIQKEERTPAGIIIPETAKEKPRQGMVVAVGPGKKDEPMQVKKDDMVLYGEYSGTELKWDDKRYLIMRSSEIYAILGKA